MIARFGDAEVAIGALPDLARKAGPSLIVAEQMPGFEPQARHFPRRNHIIAGLAAGTLVVEGAPKSSSLIKVRVAAEAGREVMAVPGSPLDPRSGVQHPDS